MQKHFPDQEFEQCETHTSLDKTKFPIGSIWYNKQSERFGRVVGYPLNDYYNDDYVGMCFFDIKGDYVAFGASRAIHLVANSIFPFGFKPHGEPKN